MEAFTFNTVELILLSAAGILFIIQLIYYFGLYNRIHARNKAVRKEAVHFTQEMPPLSVILCARNEADNLRKILPAILEQDYPQFEVIVINDASTDETEDVLGFMEEKYPHLYHSFTPDSARYISHKKLALTLGIKASKHDWLVFTETNCMPASKDWLRLMARNFTSQTQIVLGYSGYDRTKGWLHKRVAFDTLFQSLRYLCFALAGKPYMGIGRNMAYRKELFFQRKGYSTYLNLQRGEDDLFINQIAAASMFTSGAASFLSCSSCPQLICGPPPCPSGRWTSSIWCSKNAPPSVRSCGTCWSTPTTARSGPKNRHSSTCSTGKPPSR